MYQSNVATGTRSRPTIIALISTKLVLRRRLEHWYKLAGNPIRESTLPVSIYPCSSCGQRQKGRLATFYNAWFSENGARVCYRQRLCVACVTTVAGSLLASASESSPNVSVCPNCGSDSAADLSPLYLTIYLPKQEAREYALTTCTSCAKQWQESLSANAELMADKPSESVGAADASAWSEVLP